MGNIESVRQMYAAFQRGDIPAILERLSESVEWEYGSNTTDVPWLQPRRGREAVAGFFAALEALEFLRFEPKTFLESGNIVVTLIDLEVAVKATRMPIVEEDEVHIWHFDASGKVSRFRHKVDTYQTMAAYHGGRDAGGASA